MAGLVQDQEAEIDEILLAQSQEAEIEDILLDLLRNRKENEAAALFDIAPDQEMGKGGITDQGLVRIVITDQGLRILVKTDQGLARIVITDQGLHILVIQDQGRARIVADIAHDPVTIVEEVEKN